MAYMLPMLGKGLNESVYQMVVANELRQAAKEPRLIPPKFARRGWAWKIYKP